MYTDLKSYQQTVIIHDFTVEFCKKYIDKFSRTTDQMVQAARSGKQNIAEGSSFGKTDPKLEYKLINVARSSLKELLEDYQDYLRQHGLPQWGKDEPRSIELRNLAYKTDPPAPRLRRTSKTDRTYRSDRTDPPAPRLRRASKTDRSDRTDRTDKTYKPYKTYATYETYLDKPEAAANAMITIINQTNYLLDQQLKALETQMKDKGVVMETQNQKISRIRREELQREQDFWKEQKQAGLIKLDNGRFVDLKKLTENDLNSLDLDEQWNSLVEVKQIWHKLHQKP